MTSLPGFASPLRSRLFSGYLKASAANQTFYAHYVLTESQTNPADDPLVLWQQGGPGSWLRLRLAGRARPVQPRRRQSHKEYERNPRVFEREYSWDANANLLLFEHPPGTGFSYCVDASDQIVDCQWNDQTQAAAFYETLSAFYAAFPSYAASDLHLIGESYAGLLLPFLTAEIYRHPDETAAKQLRGLAVGNGCPGTSGATPSNRGSCNGPYGTFDQQHVLELVAGHSALPRALWADLQSACGFPCAAPTWSERCDGPWSSKCQTLINEANAAAGRFNIYNFYDNCGDGNQEGVGTMLEHAQRLADPSTGGQSYPCGTGKAATVWANMPEVRAALHMKPESFYGRPWSLQASGMQYTTYTGAILRPLPRHPAPCRRPHLQWRRRRLRALQLECRLGRRARHAAELHGDAGVAAVGARHGAGGLRHAVRGGQPQPILPHDQGVGPHGAAVPAGAVVRLLLSLARRRSLLIET